MIGIHYLLKDYVEGIYGMMYGNEMSTCQLSRMKFSCCYDKNISINHNLCIKLFL